MRIYRVIGKPISFPAGAVLQLSESQAEVRKRHLQPLGDGRFITGERTDFIAGEEIGIDGEFNLFVTRVQNLELIQDLEKPESGPAVVEASAAKIEKPEKDSKGKKAKE